MKKIITYFVSGGHGTTACKEAWEQPGKNIDIQIETHLCIGVVDDGGHSGLLRRIFEELNEPYIPLGDLRNIWAESIKNSVMTELIQRRISPSENLTQFQETLVKELMALKSLILIYCQNGNALQKYLSDNQIEDFVAAYIKGFKQLLNKTKEELYNKHNIGNLFFAALTYSRFHTNGKNGYLQLSEVIEELGLFPQNLKVHLLDNKRLDLLIQNAKGEIIVQGEGSIDVVEFPIKVGAYEVFDPITKLKPAKREDIIQLINKSDIVIIPPGSETNSYPWVKYYAEQLREKLVVRIVNLTVEQSSEGFIQEMGFLESLGLRPIYLYPKTFSHIKKEIGEEAYFKLIAKYSQQNKRPQDLSTQTILKGLHLSYPQIFDSVSEEDIFSRILDIVDVHAYSVNNETIHELSANKEDEPYISQKGFRHSTLQLGKVIHEIVEMSNVKTKELTQCLREAFSEYLD